MADMSISGAGSTIAAFDQAKEFAGSETVYIVGTNVEYAAYVELGTSKMEAQPYLFPAAKRVARNPGAYVDSPDTVDEFVAQVALAMERKAKERAPVDTGRLRASIKATKVN